MTWLVIQLHIILWKCTSVTLTCLTESVAVNVWLTGVGHSVTVVKGIQDAVSISTTRQTLSGWLTNSQDLTLPCDNIMRHFMGDRWHLMDDRWQRHLTINDTYLSLFVAGSHASPTPFWFVSVWPALDVAGQLSHASPTLSPSPSSCPALATRGQLSEPSATPGRWQHSLTHVKTPTLNFH